MKTTYFSILVPYYIFFCYVDLKEVLKQEKLNVSNLKKEKSMLLSRCEKLENGENAGMSLEEAQKLFRLESENESMKKEREKLDEDLTNLHDEVKRYEDVKCIMIM